MKIKKIALSIAVLSLLSIPSLASAEEEGDEFSWLDRGTWSVEASGEVISTIGVFTGKGSTHNPKRDSANVADEHYAGDLYRSEITAKLFLNQEVGEESSWHAGLQLNKDGNAEDGYDFTRNYSQFDWLRELYLDTTTGENMSWRIGKQQVVWGKADGVKFLDIINPTDFRHWGQDSMEDSRIPLWMITGEYAIGDDASLQVVYVPQVDVTNQIPGLYKPNTGDQGEEFVPLGMETMFGQKNGFLNIGPELGSVAGAFNGAFNIGFTGAPTTNPNMLAGFTSMTVKQFTQMPDVGGFIYSQNGNNAANVNLLGLSANGGTDGFNVTTGDQMLAGTANGPTSQGGIASKTNLMGNSLNTDNPQTMFDYMGDTSFATFDAFIGLGTKHVKDHAKNNPLEGNLGLRYSGATDGGLNYTFNYYYHYDNNPVIDVSWEESNTGKALVANTSAAVPTADPSFSAVTMSLAYADGTGAFNSAGGTNGANMVFTEKQHRINTLGLSFDYAIDNSFAPVILRSEIVYDKDTLVPVVDLGKLAYGDFAGAFTNQKASFLNYVVGLDVTVMRNLFMSFQFMDKWNLDYVDENVQYAGNSKTYSKHTANPATMSLSNGFKAGEEHAIAYTFFMSKPLMESDALRVNNIFLLENENYGWWDRFDLEYSYSDDIVLTAAINQYGGDTNGVFGQFQYMSNAQVGFKYIF